MPGCTDYVSQSAARANVLPRVCDVIEAPLSFFRVLPSMGARRVVGPSRETTSRVDARWNVAGCGTRSARLSWGRASKEKRHSLGNCVKREARLKFARVARTRETRALSTRVCGFGAEACSRTPMALGRAASAWRVREGGVGGGAMHCTKSSPRGLKIQL